MAPVFAHGQLRLYLLELLESGAKHGYELITALSDRFGGTYRPSPGTIYPRLARLEEEGLVQRTDAGQQVLDARRDELATIEQDLAETVRGLADRVRDDVRGAMRGLRADLAAVAQSARAEATPSSPPATEGEERLGSRTRAVETEALLQQFRDEMRAELRRVSAGRGLKQLTVDTVRTVLDSARSAIRSTLG